MRKTKHIAIMRRAIEKYGAENQVDKAIEEMSELTKALLKFRHGAYKECPRSFYGAVIEELADVMIMCAQLEMIFEGDVRAKISEKLERLERGMNEDGV